MYCISQNLFHQCVFQAAALYKDPALDVEIDILVTGLIILEDDQVYSARIKHHQGFHLVNPHLIALHFEVSTPSSIIHTCTKTVSRFISYLRVTSPL